MFYRLLLYMRGQVLVFLLLISLAMSQTNGNSNSTYKKDIQVAGDYIQIALPVIALTTTFFEEKGEDSNCFLKSFLATVVITHSMKYLISKQRPNGSNEFNSMPSGHTSASFHAAAFIQMHYGWEYGAPAYALAAFVGYSRIEGYNQRHDLFDVLVGATLGIATSYYFYSSDSKSQSLRVQSDYINNGVSLVYSF